MKLHHIKNINLNMATRVQMRGPFPPIIFKFWKLIDRNMSITVKLDLDQSEFRAPF